MNSYKLSGGGVIMALQVVCMAITAVSGRNTLKDKGLVLFIVSVQLMDAGMFAGAHSYHSR